MDLLFKSGKVVTASSIFKADVAVKDGRICAIGTDLVPESSTEVVDAGGKLILPGHRRTYTPGHAFRWNDLN